MKILMRMSGKIMDVKVGDRVRVDFGIDFVDGTSHKQGKVYKVTEENLSYFQHPSANAFYTKL